MKRNILYIFLYILIILPAACRDDLLEGENDFIPEGTSRLTAVVNFKSLTPALNGMSRTAGNAIRDINSLTVLLYDRDSNLIEQREITDYTVRDEVRDDADAENGTVAETKTPHAEFSMSIPYGRYFMYAVANMKDLKDHDVSTVKKLKSISLSWKENIVENNQMLGHFTVNEKEGGKDETLVVDQKRMTLHAWVRRVVSKVTVAYDASGLKDGVFVYLKSVRVRDIPNTCFLGDTNTIKDEKSLIEGEIIYYYEGEEVPAFDERYPVRLAAGVPRYGEHDEMSNALFFYENVQGVGKDKRQDADGNGKLDNPGFPGDDTYSLKDDKPYGTYIEVDAYYVSVNPKKVGRGSIKYRFMLGKDVERDYNAERNYHYKLTLTLKNFANDADWHIEYKEPKPGIEVPNPYYISYLYNHSMMLPLKINAGNNTVTSIKAEIIDNRWAPHQARADFNYHRDMDIEGENQWNGFLSLRETDSTVITGTPPISVYSNQAYYVNRKRGERVYDDMSEGAHLSIDAPSDAPNDKYTVKHEKTDSGNIYHVALPMYTRAKQLIKATGYTGNNPYVAYQRKAVVRITATLSGGGEPLVEDVTIYQVRRVVNPKGVWRKASNTTPFHVVLKRLPMENAKTFEVFPSEGPWKAYVVKPEGSDFISLTGGSKVEKDTVYGLTGSNIDFRINFNGTCDETVSRHAIVRVEYHNYSCYHLIFVRQGYAPCRLTDNGATWHTCNMKTGTEETSSPMEEGSLFRFGNWEQPIDAMSNKNPVEKKGGYWINVTEGDFVEDREKQLIIAGTNGTTSQWKDINYQDAKTSTFSEPTGKTWRVASFDDYVDLYNDPNIEQGFGILYGDDASKTADDINEAYGYDYENKAGRGMRGCFVYNKITGKNLFFPIGASGYGHRKYMEKDGWGSSAVAGMDMVLRYASGRIKPYVTDNAPLFYDIYMRPGAIYWFDKQVTKTNNSTLNDMKGGENDASGWDFNYFTFDFFPISTSSLRDGADACFIRCVEK